MVRAYFASADAHVDSSVSVRLTVWIIYSMIVPRYEYVLLESAVTYQLIIPSPGRVATWSQHERAH